MHPYSLPDLEDDSDFTPYYPKIDRIPHGKLGIRRGAKVHASDGNIGQVDEFLISPEDHHISYLILREGHLWGKKLVTIPVSEIDHIEEDRVFLKLNKRAIKKLPILHVKRHSI